MTESGGEKAAIFRLFCGGSDSAANLRRIE